MAQTDMLEAAFEAGQLLNRVDFYAQQACFGLGSSGERMEELSNNLAIKVRNLVAVRERERIQMTVREPLAGLLRSFGTEDHSECLLDAAQRMSESPESLRAEIVFPVLMTLKYVRKIILDSIPPKGVLAFQLGEKIDQGICPPNVHEELFLLPPIDVGTSDKNLLSVNISTDSEVLSKVPKRSALGGKAVPGCISDFANTPREPGELQCKYDWRGEVTQLWQENELGEAIDIEIDALTADIRLRQIEELSVLAKELLRGRTLNLVFGSGVPSEMPEQQTDDETSLDQYAQPRKFASDEIKGKERALVEILCDSNGTIKISDLDALPSFQGADAFEGFKGAQRRLKPKLKKQGWEVIRHDGHAKLQRLPEGPESASAPN